MADASNHPNSHQPGPSHSTSDQPNQMPDDRWQDLLRSVDPVANIAALTDIWRQAAASSEQVLGGFVQPRPGTANGDGATSEQAPEFTSRDMLLDFERSVDQMADAFKRFFGQMPWGIPTTETASASATAAVVVLDGVGTTELTLPAGTGAEPARPPWATDLVRHDGARIGSDLVTIRSTPSFNHADAPGGAANDGRGFILKVAIGDDTEAGIYHGQVLCPGATEFVLPIEARVYRDD